MTEYLEKYLELRKEWSILAFEGKDEEYEKLVEKAHKELYPNFDKSDWEYIIAEAPNVQAKMKMRENMEKFLKE